jgi:hypothetical protein
MPSFAGGWKICAAATSPAWTPASTPGPSGIVASAAV